MEGTGDTSATPCHVAGDNHCGLTQQDGTGWGGEQGELHALRCRWGN